MAKLGKNRYGKAGIRLVKVARDGAHHDIRDLTVAVALEGDFEVAHVTGSNAQILPTDTMKNTIYALAKEHFTGSVEEYALFLTQHFMTAAPITGARVNVEEHLWNRLNEHSFTRGGDAVRTVSVQRTAAGATVQCGVQGLYLLKTTHSEFTGYIKDKYTTLPETTDRIFATVLNAEWDYEGEGEVGLDYDLVWADAMAAIRDTFASQHSLSVQHTLYAMGEELIERCPAVARVRFVLPNKHHILMDLSRFGVENPNEIFVAPTEPYGLIEAEIVR